MIHILIVEDEKPISNLIRMSLTKAGYNCTCAFDGEEAWNLISANPYDGFPLAAVSFFCLFLPHDSIHA